MLMGHFGPFYCVWILFFGPFFVNGFVSYRIFSSIFDLMGFLFIFTGMDLNCGSYLKEHTKQAVEQKKITYV